MTSVDEKNERHTIYPKRMSADLLPPLCPSRTAGWKETSGDFAPRTASFPKGWKIPMNEALGAQTYHESLLQSQRLRLGEVGPAQGRSARKQQSRDSKPAPDCGS